METKKYVRIIRNVSKYGDKTGRIFPSLGTWEDSYKIDGPAGVMYVRKRDAEVIVTEKRKAAVGERVLLTAPTNTKGNYRVGDLFTVRVSGETGVNVAEDEFMTLWHKEYEVIIENEEVDGMENVNQSAIDSASTVFEKVGDSYIGSKSRFGDILIGAQYSESFVKAYASERKDVFVIPKTIEYTAFLRSDEMKEVARNSIAKAMKSLRSSFSGKSAQARRDEIVEQAKADVEELSSTFRPGCPSLIYPPSAFDPSRQTVEFIVNSKKRTVVVLITYVSSITKIKNVAFRGISKAAPSDCFNVHIGKAIALRRALGLAVPDEYLNAPQPTEVRVGDVVRGKYKEVYCRYRNRWKGGNYDVTIKEISEDRYHYVEGGYDFIGSANLTIIDDSREEVGE
ncbi:hypothetical protein MOB54_02740 [Bacillus spizizenii]|nr:hypothetical protein [Bacillus spizizenii]